MSSFRFEISSTSGRARTATVHGHRRSFRTPVFMPVGTRGSVKLLPPDLLAQVGFEVMLSNTYHLLLRPGADVIADLGGLHRFNGWDDAILTDSGGFQVMSLGATYSEEGVAFKSVYDGSSILLTPEDAVAVQEQLGSDIAMVLDVCTMLPASSEELVQALEMTTRWARRASEARSRSDQAMFSIVQGGTNMGLRRRSVEGLLPLEFEGVAIGGLAVGEERSLTVQTIRETVELLPEESPRYLMGVGDPYTVAHGIGLGIDMFDCVAPSRVARHGIGWTSLGKISVKRSEYRRSESSLDPSCSCTTCTTYPIGFLNHLLKVDQGTLGVLLTRHNLTFMHGFIERARAAIMNDSFTHFLQEVDSRWS